MTLAGLMIAITNSKMEAKKDRQQQLYAVSIDRADRTDNSTKHRWHRQ